MYKYYSVSDNKNLLKLKHFCIGAMRIKSSFIKELPDCTTQIFKQRMELIGQQIYKIDSGVLEPGLPGTTFQYFCAEVLQYRKSRTGSGFLSSNQHAQYNYTVLVLMEQQILNLSKPELTYNLLQLFCQSLYNSNIYDILNCNFKENTRNNK